MCKLLGNIVCTYKLAESFTPLLFETEQDNENLRRERKTVC